MGLHEREKRTKRMRQVVDKADAERQATAERSPSPQTPHPRANQAITRGIRFPISHYFT